MSEQKAVISADHLVGNLYFSLSALPLIAGQLDPATFRTIATPQAGMVYSEMCRLMASESEQLSAGALEAGLRLQGFDFKWLSELQTRIMPEPVQNLYSYVGEINNAADLRNLQLICNDAIEQAQKEDARAEMLAAKVMAGISGTNRNAINVQPVTAATRGIRERLNAIRSGQMQWGAMTGFPDLDRLMRLVDSELILFGGRPSQGKTQLALQILIERARQLKEAEAAGETPGQVLIFSTEMGKEDLFFRCACSLARVNSDRLSMNQADDDEWDRIYAQLDYLDTLPIEVDDTPGITVEKVYYRAVMANAQKPVRLVVTDHTEIYSLGDHYSKDGETTRVSKILMSFKSTARTIRAPWIDCHQLGREVDARPNKQPMLSDMKYSGEQHGDKVLFISRPEYYLKRGVHCECDPQDSEGVAICTLAKDRNGPIGQVKLGFVEKYARFEHRPMERVSLEY